MISSPAPTFTATATPANQVSASFQQGVYPDAAYSGASDTPISQANPAANYGSSSALFVDGDDPAGSGNDLSTLLRWEVSSLQAGSTV